MALTLHTIKPAKNSQKKKKKIGRGGKRGTYSGKGQKGQKARSGVSGLKRLGMRQLIEQTHKLKGFKSRNIKSEILNLFDLNKKFSIKNDTNPDEKKLIKINPNILEKNGLIKKNKNGIKILGNGEINIKIEVKNCEVSKSAKEKIEKAGGKVI